MFRTIRRVLVLAIATALSVSGGASAGVLPARAGVTTTATFTTTTPVPGTVAAPGGGVFTDNTCGAVTPVIHDLKVLGAPTAGSGKSCTNDLQCDTLQGEACTFASVSSAGICSASGLLSRDNIHYVAGNLIDVEVTIPECTGVSTVSGVTLLGGTGPDASAAPVSWTFLPAGPPTTVGGQPAIRQRLRIQFSNLGDGNTASIPIQVMARTGGATATRSFSLAGVAAVNAAIRSSVAETRIRNAFVTSIYEKFGDSEQVFDEDGKRIAYGVDWSELTPYLRGDQIHFRGSDIRIVTDRIIFASTFMADADGCDPTVFVDGWFRLVPNGDGVDLDWIQAPLAEADAGLCSLVTLGLYELVVDGFADEEAIAAPFAKTIAAGFDADENGHIKICDLCRVSDVKIGDRKLEIWTIPPVDRVRLNVSSTRGTDATANPSQGLLLPAGYYAPIAGGGTIETCVAENGMPANCEKLTVDMDGAFNWWGTDVPVPSPIAYNESGVAAVVGGRANAWERLTGVTRHAATLPAPTFPADALIARRSALTMFAPTSRARVANGCVLPPLAASPYRIAFGVNDLPNSPPTRGKLEATVLIAQNKEQSAALFGHAKACAAEPVSGGVIGTTTGTTGTF